MDEEGLRRLLEDVAAGRVGTEEASLRMRMDPFADLGFAKVDLHRGIRQGVPEVIFGETKTPEHIVSIARRLLDAGNESVLITRLPKESADAVGSEIELRYDPVSRIGIAGTPTEERRGCISVITAGTSDIPVAEEAAQTAEALGNRVVRIFDAGVSGLHRLMAHTEDIMSSNAIVAVAGMEGALASVVGGMADCPVIAVPTSVGYGASFGGVAALLAMLNSCASGVSVVNIDNGFGAGYIASMINRAGERRRGATSDLSTKHRMTATSRDSRMSKISVAVLGATGMIGQRFIQMLEDHPYFEIEGLYASERSQGKRLGEVLKVRDHVYLDETLERRIETMDVGRISKGCRIAFSGIPSDLAGPTEAELAQSGVAVFTNAGSHRMDEHVPILIPEVNPDQLAAIEDQPTYADGGYIVTNANCSSTGIAAPLRAIDDSFGLRQVFVSTYQALSGAGYPGVPSLDAVGNVVPYIGGEEEKMESELAKMLGTYRDGRFEYAGFKVMANCARVPVVDGHLESLVLDMEGQPSLDELAACLSGFRGEPQTLGLPSAPEQPIIVRSEDNRPQPVFDAMAGRPERARGMAVTIGRLRRSNGYYKAFAMSHNTLRGGAGGSVLNAELARAKGLLRGPR